MTQGKANQLLNRRYRLERRIGFGGMGAVYLATDERLGRTVAVKELRHEYAGDEMIRKRFIREAQAAARLSHHPHVVTIHDFFEEGVESLYIVMEYLDGGTFLDRMNEAPLRRVDLRQALKACREALEGLQAAHDLGLVHRDVKPGNLLFDGSGAIKIADFGVVTALAGEQEREITTLTQVGTHPGTLVYMSPEQIDGAEVDGRSDVYSMGAVLYEAIAGIRYFERHGMRRTERALMDAICEVPPIPLRQHVPYIPEEVESLLTASLAKLLDDRPTAREMADAIIEIERRRLAQPQIVDPQDEATRPGQANAVLGQNVRVTLRNDPHAATLPRARVVEEPPPSRGRNHETEPSTLRTSPPERARRASDDALDRPAMETRANTASDSGRPPLRSEAPTQARLGAEPMGENDRSRKDSAVEIVVPASSFPMGGGMNSDEFPRREVSLDTYLIDRDLVTVGQYRRFLDSIRAGDRPEGVPLLADLYPNGKDHRPQGWGSNEFGSLCPTDKHPIVLVDWFDACAYAAWVDARLPTEAEWERAARGDHDVRDYPWGTEPPTAARALYGRRTAGPAPVGQHPQGASPSGTLDMAGNVWEWCLDAYDADAYGALPNADPLLPVEGPGARAVKRGGSWTNAPHSLRCAKRGNEKLHIRRSNLGFRCARSL
jgi:serine/threonine protein kinase